ncbi:hypothetical protein CYMTET_19314 [Cymbomonas tetramitiformis]|uniref:F-box domain-containing protein n=1 Tax=Cymbomonas tetramitiformis TaxID=36881 RepID=A0AAE0G6A2_9CHLO|nr:hypothetical protein CYMTET_19314 [Cymbomonas tetramitiformis]
MSERPVSRRKPPEVPKKYGTKRSSQEADASSCKSRATKSHHNEPATRGIAEKTQRPRSYVRPGLLAQFVKAQRYVKSSSATGFPRIASDIRDRLEQPKRLIVDTAYAPILADILNQRKRREWGGDVDGDRPSTSSRSEDLMSLPCDLLMKIVCNLRHSELQPLLRTCVRLRHAAMAAIVVHFNFVTPEPANSFSFMVGSPPPAFAAAAVAAFRDNPIAPPRARGKRRHRRRPPVNAARPTSTADSSSGGSSSLGRALSFSEVMEAQTTPDPDEMPTT